MFKRLACVVVAFAALSCLVAACGSSSDSSSGSTAEGSSTAEELATAEGSEQELTKLRYQLSWLPSSQFAGLYVAQEKGYFADHGLEVELIAGGPSINPINAIANGSADLGDSQPSSVVLARSQGLPLTEVYQLQQESATVYVAKKSSGIEDLKDVEGKRVGLYFGGYQAEFLSMLKDADIDPENVNMIPQPSTMVPFLEGQYDVAMAIVWNELLTIEDEVPADELTIMRPSEYGGGLVGTSIATSEEFAADRSAELQQFLDAAAEGWVWTLEHPNEAAKIVTESADGLDLEFEERLMQQRIKVICTGPTMEADKGLGYIDPAFFDAGQEILLDTGQIDETLPTDEMYQTKFWEAIPDNLKHPKCSEEPVN